MTPSQAAPPRERIVYSATQLLREKGVAGTGLREVVERADAPWGSLQHYFPGGKEQIVREAVDWAATFAAGRINRFCEQTANAGPGALFAAMARQWEREFTDRGFARGCPLVAVAADSAGSDELRTAVRDGFAAWAAPLAAALRRMDVPRARSESLATLMLSALEGAIVLARTQQDVKPLRTVVRELRPLLDGAVRPRAGR